MTTRSASVINLRANTSNSLMTKSELEFGLFGQSKEDNNPEDSSNSYHEGWIISYIDILTLLLTLFVILLAMSHFKADTTSHNQLSIKTGQLEKQLVPIKTPNINLAFNSENQNIKDDTNNEKTSSNDTQKAQAILSTDAQNEEKIITHSNISKQENLDYSDTNNYLNIGSAKLFSNELNAAKILPVQSSHLKSEPSHLPHEKMESGIIKKAETTQNITPLPQEHLAIIQQIENSQLIDKIDISENQGHVNLAIKDHVLFSPGSEKLKPEGLNLLEELAVMLGNTHFNLSVEGHTDNIPINNQLFNSNWELSTARATMVTHRLIESNVEPHRIRAIGYADTRPRADNATQQGRENNRRVSITLHMPDAQ